MNTIKIKPLYSGLLTLGIVTMAAPMLAACTSRMQSIIPTASYTFDNDDELIQTIHLAKTYCNQYGLAPQSSGFAHDQGSSGVANFECVATLDSAVTADYSNLTYTYQSDQKLIDASQNAHSYCMGKGSRSISSKIESNLNGTKTIRFKCNPSGE